MALCAAFAACSGKARSGKPLAPLYTDLGSHHHAVTSSPAAQQYFDQGLRLMYAFNHDEAIASFKEGARLDPNCAMCWWGVALSLGPNINLPMDPKTEPQAQDAARKAAALALTATPIERDYIAAVAKRYTDSPVEDRAALDTAYAEAMGAVAAKYPDDLDAATLWAEALMDLQPWSTYTVGGEPRGRILGIVRTLEAVIAKHPNHPGACHYYIHAVEASLDPDRALPCAERLAHLMPGAGHIVHMPAHIYMRIGRYDLAVQHNQHAATEDLKFIEARHPVGAYPLIYIAHNYHLLSAALAMQGKGDESIAAAREMGQYAPAEAVRQFPALEYYSPTPYVALARFARWDQILTEPAPPADLRYTTGFYHYVRGLALAGTGKPAATVERDSLAAIESAMPPDAMANLNPMKTLLGLAKRHLDADLAFRQGRKDHAVRLLREAVTMEDDLTYDEPPPWYLPMRQVLGNTLLAMGRLAEAEQAFRDDLKRNRENGWSLRGLAAALGREGKGKEAAEVEARYRKAWAGPDRPSALGSQARQRP